MAAGSACTGSADFDAETNTYVSTWCASLVFVPVWCLRAYRVAKSQRGWYFLGREPLSGAAKGWNIALLCGIVFIVAGLKYDAYVSSPSYKAHKQMASANELVKGGHLADGAKIYQTLAVAGADESDNATAAMKGLVDNGCAQAPLSESAGVFASAAQVARRGSAVPATDVAEQGLKLANDKGDSDPRGARGDAGRASARWSSTRRQSTPAGCPFCANGPRPSRPIWMRSSPSRPCSSSRTNFPKPGNCCFR